MKKIISLCIVMVAVFLFAAKTNAQVDVTSSGGTPTASYGTLKGAFDAINAGTHTGTITIGISNNTTETATAVLNASGSGSASYTSIVVNPTGGASRTISGAITAGSPLIDMNGADNVTFDGLNTGGNSLIIENTTASATSGTCTFRFIGGATSNAITNCSVKGAFSAAVGTNGGNIFFSTDAVTANGNDNNTISNCDLGPSGANLPTKCVYGNGSTTTTAIGNSGIVINNCDIHDFFGAAVTSAGVYTAGGCNNWTVSNNRFYQTATRTWTTGAQHSPIWLINTTSLSGMQGAVVTGNIIGYSANNQTGTYTLTGAGTSARFWGIHVNGISTGTLSRISNNTIASVSMTSVTGAGTSTSSPFIAIHAQEGVFNTDSNTIGSQSATGSLTFSTTTTSGTEVMGIYNFSSNTWNSRNNTIGGISVTNLGASGTFVLYGMRANTGTTVTHTATNNIVGGTVANSLSLISTGSSSWMVGIHSSNAPAVWTSNTVRNLTTNNGSGTGTTASIIGLNHSSATPVNVMSQNTIYNLTNTAAAVATTVCGIQFTGSTGANLVERNFIHSFSVASATGIMNGINVGGGTTTYKNNMIRLGIDGSGAAVTTGCAINGINETAGIDNFYNNSVYVGGTGVAGTANTFAFSSTVTSSTRSYQNNIFVNVRNNGAGTGKHYAIRVGGTTVNPTGLTSNYNAFYVSGTGTVFGFYNSLDVADLNAWKTATGQDANSISGFDPQYINPTGTSSTVNLHISATNPTVIEGSGLALASVTDDYDGQARSGLTPTDIGADAGNFVAQDVSAPAISYTALGSTGSTSNRTLTATITDISGVPTAGALQPRIYYRKNGGSYFSSQGTLNSGSATNGTWGFTIISSDMGGVAPTDVINYFVIAQDINGLVSANPGAGLVATDVNTVTTPPTSPNSYIITGAPLSGSYTIGTTLFRPIGGGKVEMQARTRTVRKIISGRKDFDVTKQVEKPGVHSSDALTADYEADVTETYFVPVVNGIEYTGSLYHEYTTEEKIQLGLSDAMVGDYATLSAAITDLNTRGVSGATTFNLTDASYSEAATLTIAVTNEAVPTASNTVTFKPAASVTPVITVNTTGVAFSIASAYIIFDGSNSGSTSRDMSIINSGAGANSGAAFITVPNVTMKNLKAMSTNFSSGYGIVYSGTAVTSGLVQNCDVQRAVIGIQIQGGTTNVTISGNSVGSTDSLFKVTNGGIIVLSSTNFTVSNNNIVGVSRNSGTAGTAGIQVGNSGLPSSANGTIYSNIVSNVKFTGFNSAAYGAYGIYLGTDLASSGISVYNNSIYDINSQSDGSTTGTSYTPHGIYVVSGGGYQIYYNSISMYGQITDPDASAVRSGCITVEAGTNVGTLDIRNNICQNTMTMAVTGSVKKNYAFISNAANTAYTNLDYNDYFVSGADGILGFWASADQSNLNAIRTASGKDVNSLNVNPQYTSATNLTPQTYDVNGRGYPLSLVTTDITGAARNTTVSAGPTDPGAYEFTPPYNVVTTMVATINGDGTYTYAYGGTTYGSITITGYTTDNALFDISWIHYQGVNPPGSTSQQFNAAYDSIWVSNGAFSAASYNVQIFVPKNNLRNIADTSHIILAKSNNGGTLWSAAPGTSNGYNAGNPGYAFANGLTSFSLFAVTSSDNPLPVEMASFASLIDKRNVDLKWSTSHEENNSGFDVERKLATESQWVKIGNVQGAGNSSAVKNYSFGDRNLASGKYNYRLKQIDFNGNYKYFDLSNEVIIGVPTKYDMSQNYPNPFNPTTKINYDLPFDSKVSIKIFDMTGKEVATVINTAQTAGYYTVQFNALNLASGVYFYNITAEGGNAAKFITTKKMVLVK